MLIRELKTEELPVAMDLVRDVFLAFEAPDYEPEGVEEFFRTVESPEFLAKIRVYSAWEEEKLIGVLATRSEGRHIALFFVNANCQGRGIGKKLFEQARKHAPKGHMTVNSSPYAVAIYRRLGFVDTDQEQVVNGIRFTPMALGTEE